MLGDVSRDGTLELADAAKVSAAYAFRGDLRRKPFNRVQPGRTCWREVDVVARMFGESSVDDRMLMRRVVVHDQVNIKRCRHVSLNVVEVLHELRMAMA